jgi:hypothetical protein
MSGCSLLPATERTEDDKDKEVVDDLKRALLSSILQCLLVLLCSVRMLMMNHVSLFQQHIRLRAMILNK